MKTAEQLIEELNSLDEHTAIEAKTASDIRVPGLQWIRDPDRRFDTVEIRAPLIRAIQRIRSAILDDLPKAFSLPAGEIQGQEIPLLPDRVIREVVANAVMHRDYRVHGSIQIIRYANRLEVRNPGYSLKAEERLGEPGSETRNPKIAAILHDVKYAETKGSGIRVMRELMDERNLSMPLLQSDRTGNSFLVMLLFHHFLSQDDLDWLKSFEHDSLNDEEMKAMISAREVGAIDNSTYRDINRGSDTLSASKHLRKLCDCGLLEKRGQGPATYYIPTDRALEKWPPNSANESKMQDVAGKSTKHEVKTTKLDDKSTKLDGKTTKLDDKSTKVDGKTTKLDDKSNKLVEELPEIPSEIRSLIDSLGGKGNLSTAFDAVVALLKWKELSVKDIASYLDRTPSHVRREYIAPLIQADLIRPTIPDNPTDPRQTYRATNSPKKDVQ